MKEVTSMDILIVGTGVIGTLYACALSEKHNVFHFVRKEKINRYNEKKITYDFIDERNDKHHQNTTGSYIYHCVTEIHKDYDLIIVPVKSYQLDEALHTLIQQAPHANYLLFTLDWDSRGMIDSILSKKQYIMGYAGGGGTFKGDLLWANLGNDLMLGAGYPEQIPLLQFVTDLFKDCRINPQIAENPFHWLWVHNVGSAPLGVALTKYKDMPRLLNDKSLVKTSFRAIKECYKICEKRGVNLKAYDEVGMMSLPLFLLYPLFKRNFTKNPIMKRYSAHAVDAIDEMVNNFKAIYETGSALGVDMPNMQLLLDMIST